MNRWVLRRGRCRFVVRGPISAQIARLLFAAGWIAGKEPATFVCADFPDVTVAAAERLELLLRDDLLDDDEASDAVRLVLAAGWRPLADPNWCKRRTGATW